MPNTAHYKETITHFKQPGILATPKAKGEDGTLRNRHFLPHPLPFSLAQMISIWPDEPIPAFLSDSHVNQVPASHVLASEV